MKTARFPLALRVLLSTACCLLPTAYSVGLAPEAQAQIPGPELFAKEPRTPLELWEAVDYLVRTSQAKKAVPYLDKFVKSEPDDATLIAVRNRYGLGSILRLNDDPATQPFAEPIAKKYRGGCPHVRDPARADRPVHRPSWSRAPRSRIMPSGISGKPGRTPCRFWSMPFRGRTSRPTIENSWSTIWAGSIARRFPP